MIILQIIIGMYALLTIVAVLADLQHNGISWLQPIYLLSSIILIVSVFTDLNLIYLCSGLLGLMIIALLTGIIQKDFHWSHHFVRFIVSTTILLAAIYLKK